MTESAARQALIAKAPKFETYSTILQDVCIAGYIAGYEEGYIDGMVYDMTEPEAFFPPIAGIDFKTGVDGLFDAVKKITDDYNQQILKP